MNIEILKPLPRLLEILGLDEPPMGIFYTDQRPVDALSPKPSDLPTREKEIQRSGPYPPGRRQRLGFITPSAGGGF